MRRATGVDKHEAARQKANFDKSVPQFTRWLRGQHDLVKKNLGVHTAYGRWIAIPDARVQPGDTLNGKIVDVMLSKKIIASCERKSANFPIQGAGADIMKISMTRLCKEFYKKGWLKLGGGDDSVRMLMTIHDEIVFEIRYDRLEEAVPMLCIIMESPTKPSWKVPLIVDAQIGQDWSAKYDWLKIKAGKEPVPEWLVGYVTPGEVPARIEPEKPAPSLPAVSTVAPPVTLPKVVNGAASDIVVFSISATFLTERSVKIIKAACILSEVKEGKLLRLTDDEGNVLIEPSDGIRVNPDHFGHELRSRNLGHGQYEITK